MFNLTISSDTAWSDSLEPIGEGEISKETFEDWWVRNQSELAHLDPAICEQWIHRHWMHSRCAFLPIETLRWQRQRMATDAILTTVHREWAQTLNPESDLRVFQEGGGFGKHPTAKALDAGTWDFPIITLSTPDGIIGRNGEFPDVRLVLVEGHQRHCYLNALHKHGIAPPGPHDVFILSSPIVC